MKKFIKKKHWIIRALCLGLCMILICSPVQGSFVQNMESSGYEEINTFSGSLKAEAAQSASGTGTTQSASGTEAAQSASGTGTTQSASGTGATQSASGTGTTQSASGTGATQSTSGTGAAQSASGTVQKASDSANGTRSSEDPASVDSAAQEETADLTAASDKESITRNQNDDTQTQTPEETEAFDDPEDLEEVQDDQDYEHITSIMPDIVFNTGFMLLAAAKLEGTFTKSTCVTFNKYTSGKWHCNRYLTTGAHNYYHSYHTNRISYQLIDETYAYCIEPNTASEDDIGYTGYRAENAKSSSYWMLELDEKQRTYIQKLLAFGYPNKTYGCGKKAVYAATQTLIWEVVSKCRYKSLGSTTDKGLYNNVAAVLGDNYKKAYAQIVSGAVNGFSSGVIPSFTGKTKAKAGVVTMELNAETEMYEATVKDTNKVLSGYSCEKDGVSFTFSGNTLKIAVPASRADAVKGTAIAMTSELLDEDSLDTEIWENQDYQTVITQGSAEKMTAYFKLDWQDTARVKIGKTAYNTITGQEAPEEGAVFHMWKKSAGSYKAAAAGEKTTITIDASGYGTSAYMPLGVYCIKQYSGWKGYELLDEVIEVELSENGQLVVRDTSGDKLRFRDKIWTGSIEIVKVDGDTRTPLAGAVFEVDGSDGTRMAGTTNKKGKVTFDSLYYGVTYTWKEITAPEGYLISADCSGTWKVKKADAVLQVECENFKNRYGSISVKKIDHDGEGLAGCVFLLEYLDGKNWKPVLSRTDDGETRGRCTNENIEDGRLTSDEEGIAVFKGLCVENIQYRLTEVKAPEGYELLQDPVIYEGPLPMEVSLEDVKNDYEVKDTDVVEGDTLYSYDLSFTVQDGIRTKLPLTGGAGNGALDAVCAALLLLAGLAVLRWEKFYRILTKKMR